MMEKQIMELNKRYARKKMLKRIIALLCVFVMLFTVNSLKMVAQTLTRTPMCGLKEHQHKAKCYDASGNLVCGKVEHQHTDACYQESPTLEIEDDAALPVDGLQVDGGLDLDLDAGSLDSNALDLNNDLVVEDVAAPVVNEAPVTPTYVLGSKALLSNIIESTGLNIKIKKIKEVGIVDNDGSQVGLVEITKKENGDYRIKALRDFDQVELAIVLADEVVVVKLLDGVAPAEPVVEEPAAPQVEEAQPAPAVEVEQPEQPAPADESEQPELTVPETEDEQIELAEQPEPAVTEEQADLNVDDAQVEQEEVPAAEEMQIEEPAVEDAQVETPVVEAVEPEQPEAPAVVEEVEPEQPEAPAQEEEAEPTEAPAEEEAAEPEPTEAPVVEEPVEPEQIETPVAEEEPTEVATTEKEPTEVPAEEEPVEASVDEEAVPQQTEASALAGEIEAPAVEEAAAPELADADLTVDVPADEAVATEPTEPEQTVSVEEPEVQIEETAAEETAAEEIATEETATEEKAAEEIASIEEAVEPAPADAQAEQGDAAEEPAPADEQAEQEDATEEPAPAEELAEQGDAAEDEAAEPALADAQTPQEDGEKAVEIEGEEAAQEEIDQLPVAVDAETADGEAGEPEQDEAAVYTAGSRAIEVNDSIVTLTWPVEAKIPEDVVITIEEIEKGTEDYDLLYHQALAELPEPDQAVTQVMRFFDITLYTADGQKIEPKAPVSVVVTVNETVESDVAALHCEEVGAPMETVDANAEGESVAFDAPSFSVYGVNYHVPAEETTVNSEVTVDLSSVDTMAAAKVDGMSVSLSVADLLAGTDDAVESTVDSTVDAEQFVAEATVSSPDVTVQDGTITLPAEALEKATVSLQLETKETGKDYITTVTTHTVDIVLSDYAGRTGETVGEGVTVTALGENSLPADAKASVEENVAVPESVEVGENESATAFDINLTNANGDAITGPVAVTVMPSDLNVLADLPEGTATEDIQYQLIHVHDDGTVENVELPEGAVVVSEDGKVESFSFETVSFSTYVLKYTVDFEYNGYTFSMPGGNTMRLVELLNNIGIQITDDDIADVVFTNSNLVQVYKTTEEETVYIDIADFDGNDGDMFASVVRGNNYPEAKEELVFPAGSWIIKSMESFTSKENLTVICINGEEYSIDVTDPVNGSGEVDLANPDNATLGLSVDESVTSTAQERNISFELTLSYALTGEGLTALKSSNPAVLKYDLSNILNNSKLVNSVSNTSGNVTVGRSTIGEYEIVDNVAYITVTNRTWLDSRASLKGSLEIAVQIDEEKLGEDDETEIRLPIDSTGITIKFKKKVEEGSKNVNAVQNEDGSYTLTYNAYVQVNTDLDSLEFNDILSANQTLNDSSVKINGASVTPIPTSNGFKFDVGQALGTTRVAAGNYTVSYTTTVSKATLDALATDAKEKVTNKAQWNVEGKKNVPGGETEKEFEKPKPPTPDLKKESNPANGAIVNPDGTITYTITYGKAGEDVGGVTVHDWMTDMQVLQGSVSVSGGVTATLNGSNGLTYQDDNRYGYGTVDVFNYLIPEGTTGPVVFTYTTKVISQETAKENGIYDTVNVSNFVNENKSYKQPQTTVKVPFEKEPLVEVTKSASASIEVDGKWQPGAVISYTITIGDENTLLDGLRVTDKMTDLQKLNSGTVSMTVRGSAANIPEGGVKYYDDGKYTTGDVEVLDFTFPSGTGNGPAVITYTTTVATAAEAGAAQIFGDNAVNNTATGGKGSDGTHGTVKFPEMPLDKDVQQSSATVDGQTVKSGDTVHYVITFGDANTLMDNIMIYDEFTDLQKLVSEVTMKVGSQSAYRMPDAAHNYDSTGVIWQHYDDGVYSTGMTPVFRYTLPEGTGVGPIVVEYDAQIISEAEARDAGVEGVQNVKNKVTVGQKSDETVVTVEYPKTPTHNPKIEKQFDHWDVENHMVYWNIVVDKTSDSAFPLNEVYAVENSITIHDGVVPAWTTYLANQPGVFKLKQAVVKTQSGVELEPGKDYSIVENVNIYNPSQTGNSSGFYFPTLTEPVIINLAFVSPYDITEGYTATNRVSTNDTDEKEVTAVFHNSKIEVSKNGVYDEDNKIVTWTVTFNDGKKTFDGEIEPYVVYFEDILPEGHTVLNYSDHKENNPTIRVEYYGANYWNWNEGILYPVSISEGKIQKVNIAVNNGDSGKTGLSGQKFVIKYVTKISDEEWKEITKSVNGSKTYRNTVVFTDQGGEEYEGYKDLTITSGGYITKSDITQDTQNNAGNFVVTEDGKNSNRISYRVDINPNGYMLIGDERTLTLSDRIDTNMDLDTDSVRVYDLSGSEPVEIHNSDAINISYNDDSRIMTIGGLPDEKHLKVEYSCFARSDGVDTFTNTATIYGGGSHSSYIEKQHRVETSNATMEGGTLELTLQKIDHDKITKRLPGAKFKLYKLTFDGVTDDDYNAMRQEIENNPQMTGYINNKFSLTNATEECMGEFVTGDPEGQIIWNATDSFGKLRERTLFYWVETQAPTGYSDSEIGIKHYFVIYQHQAAEGETEFNLEDHQQMAWALDSTITNTNPGITVASVTSGMIWTATNTKYASITATKVWEDDEDDFYETRPVSEGIKLSLYRITPDGTKTLMSDASPVVIRPNEKGEWPNYTWTKLPFTDPITGEDYRYTVEEEPVKDYTTTYSDNGEGQTGGIITVTNRMIPKKTVISVRKQFEPVNIKKPDKIIVDLMEIRTYLDGTKTEPAKVRSEVLSASNDWAYTWDELPTTGKEKDGRYYAITYTVSERTVPNFNFVVTYSDGQQGVLEAPTTDPLVITNALEGSLKITKTITGLAEGDDLTPEEKAKIVFTVSGPNDYSTIFTYADMTDGVKTLDKLVPGDYEVSEQVSDDSVPNGYSYVQAKFTVNDTVSVDGQVTVEGDETAEVGIENEYESQSGSLKLKKQVTVNNHSTITNLADGTYTFSIAGPALATAVVKYVQINVLNGTATSYKVADGPAEPADWSAVSSTNMEENKWAVVSDLTAGDYTITEKSVAGMTTKVSGGKESKNNETANNIVVTVTAGDTVVAEAQATFTNNKDVGDITVLKRVVDGNDSKQPFEKLNSNGEKYMNDSADHDIGDTIIYTVHGTVPDDFADYTSYKYQFEDVMTNLTYVNGSAKVIVHTVDDAVQNNGQTYVITNFTPNWDASTKTLTVDVGTGGDLKTVTSGTVMTNYDRGADASKYPAVAPAGSGEGAITPNKIAWVELWYQATLDGTAEIGSTGNPNKARINHSNNPATDGIGSTTWDKNKVFTYALEINKVNADGQPLNGASFTLEKQYKTGDESFEWRTVNLNQTESTETKFVWTGIDDGIYKLTETTVPSSYLPIAPIEFEVLANHDHIAVDPQLITLNLVTTESAYQNYFTDSRTETGVVTVVTSGTIVANIPNVRAVRVPVTKTWSGAVDSDAVKSITYRITRSIDVNGVSVEDSYWDAHYAERNVIIYKGEKAPTGFGGKTVPFDSSSANPWNYTWTGLEETGIIRDINTHSKLAEGRFIYTVEEIAFGYDVYSFTVDVNGDTRTVKLNDEGGTGWTVTKDANNAFTNRLEPITASVYKTWAGPVEDSKMQSVTYELRSGIKGQSSSLEQSVERITVIAEEPAQEGQVVKSDNNWGYNWSNLPKYGKGKVLDPSEEESEEESEESQSVWGELEYTVVEVGFTYDGVKYTVEKSDDGWAVQKDGIAADYWTVTQDRDSITNALAQINLDIIKVDSADSTKKLNGAKFQLTRYNNSGVPEKFENDAFEEVKDETTEENVKKGPFTVNQTMTIQNLIPGKYLLTETKAPDGYIIMTGKVEFIVNVDGTVTYDANSDVNKNNTLVTMHQKTQDANADFTIGNEPGVALPATGGPGTTLYYVAGSALLLLALSMLLLRKKQNYD